MSISTEIDMRHATPLSPETTRLMLLLADNIRGAGHGEKRGLVEAFAAQYNWSAQRVYDYLKRVGYSSGRKCRSDAGTSSLPSDTLHFIAASKHASVRKNGKSTKPTSVAMNIADASGFSVTVSSGTINKLLRERKLDVKSQAVARNTGLLRSEHPNHVHQIDPSLCVIYYMGGKQKIILEEEFYKNKLEGLAKIKLKVWRYVRYDHASGTLDVRYFEAAGENQNSLYEFLLYTWGKQTHRLSHGVPKMLLWDKGSANTSHAIQKLLDALGVIHETHARGHSWAKGGVEKGNDVIERHLESRLRDEPVTSVEQLNEIAERWVRDYNANAIKFVDCQVKRMGGSFVRDDLWHTINAEQLITMPEREVCAWFMTAREELRSVKNLRISFAHPQAKQSLSYDLTNWARDIANGSKVRVVPMLLPVGGIANAVRIELDRLGQEPLMIQVAPEHQFDGFGRPMSAALIGAEYKSAPLGMAGEATKVIAEQTYGADSNRNTLEDGRHNNVQPFEHFKEAGLFISAHSHLGRKELPIRLPRVAQEADTPALDLARAMQGNVDTAPIPLVQLAKALRSELGDDYSKDTYAWLAGQFPSSTAPASTLDHIAEFKDAWLAVLHPQEAAATGTNDTQGAHIRRVK